MKTTYYEKLKDGKRFREIPAQLAIRRLSSHYKNIGDFTTTAGEYNLETTWAYYKVKAVA